MQKVKKYQTKEKKIFHLVKVPCCNVVFNRPPGITDFVMSLINCVKEVINCIEQEHKIRIFHTIKFDLITHFSCVSRKSMKKDRVIPKVKLKLF